MKGDGLGRRQRGVSQQGEVEQHTGAGSQHTGVGDQDPWHRPLDQRPNCSI